MSFRQRFHEALKRQIRLYVGIADPQRMSDAEALIVGLRADMDVVTVPLANTMQRLEAVVGQVNRTTQGVDNLNTRLATYERTVPILARAKKGLDARLARAARIASTNGHAPEMDVTDGDLAS